MATTSEAKVFMTGRSQAVRIPAEFRIAAKEVFVRRDAQTGDLILSQSNRGWNDIFAALEDNAGVPDDFLTDRGDAPPQDCDL